jgi:hypothetical protein
METILNYANEAIFHFQMDMKKAIRYVTKHAKCSPVVATTALQTVMIGYKHQ